MKSTQLFYTLLFGTLLGLTSNLQAQDGSSMPSQPTQEEKKVQFNGLGRAILNNTQLGGTITETDSTTSPKLTDGEFLLDLAVNAQPNANTEVQGILRIRNEFGGFFGAGVTVEVRELWARGVIANALKYRVGDFDYAMTPYTFFNPDEEGMVNLPAAFQPQKEVIYYEQFYQEGNTRRLQGAKLDFGLVFPKVFDELTTTGFVARLRGTDFLSVPTRFVGGGRAQLNTQRLADSLGTAAQIGFNLSHTWDDLQSGEATSGIRNLVWSVDFDIALVEQEKLGLHLKGEAGRSSLSFKADSTEVFDEGDSFLDLGLEASWKPADLKLNVGFIDIGPDFFSSAAQSKRVDFARNKSYFNRLGNDRQFRTPTLFDLSRDRALYTFQLSDRLMPYDPRYANVMPYGQATPNRRGIRVGVEHGEEDSALNIGVQAAFLQEIRGQGTFELKSFNQIRAFANLNIHQWIDWKNTLRLTAGFQNEQTTRGGVEIEQIDFTSNLIEVGLEAELFTRFDLLLGAQLLNASGNEYVPEIEEYNDIRDFPAPYIADDQEQLLAAGLRYRFQEDVFLTLQFHQFSLSRADIPMQDYDIQQVFVIYNMKF